MKHINQRNEFDEWYARNPVGNVQTYATNEFITRFIKPNEKRILEIGFGNGELAKELIALGKYVRGLETSRVAYKVTGIKKPLQHERFDLGIMVEVLDHIQHQQDYLFALKKRCKHVLILLEQDSPRNCPWHYHEGVQKMLAPYEVGRCNSKILQDFYNWFYTHKPYRAIGIRGGLKQKKNMVSTQKQIGKALYYIDRLMPLKTEVLYRI